MRVLIVDDEAPARDRLKRLLVEMGNCDIAGEAANGEQAVRAAQQLRPDVALLDVRMPGLSGIEVARHMNLLERPPAIIFTTAYDEYAVAAFDAQAIGYLLKPVRKDKLARALEHAARVTNVALKQLAQATDTKRRTHICARLGEQLKLIPVVDILYFLADQKYVTVRHRLGSDLIDESLKDLDTEFGGDFVRIHRNALVNETAVASVEREDDGLYRIRLRESEETLHISRRQATAVLKRLRGE